MAGLPIWLSILVSIALKIGSQWAIALVMKNFDKLPPALQVIFKALWDAYNDITKSNSQALKTARHAYKKHCEGPGCAPDTIKE